MIELLCLLTLDFLIDLRGGEPADLVTHIFDFGPGQVFRRTLLPILFVADQLRQLFQLCQHRWRIPIPTRFDFRCHAFALPGRCDLCDLTKLV
jgi:hypothetical protein